MELYVLYSTYLNFVVSLAITDRRRKKRKGARRTPTKVFVTPDTGKFHRICASGIINLRLFPPSGTRWPSHQAALRLSRNKFARGLPHFFQFGSSSPTSSFFYKKILKNNFQFNISKM